MVIVSSIIALSLVIALFGSWESEKVYTANTSFLILQWFVNSLTDRKARFHQLVTPIYCTASIVDGQAVTFMEKILRDVWHIEGST